MYRDWPVALQAGFVAVCLAAMLPFSAGASTQKLEQALLTAYADQAWDAYSQALADASELRRALERLAASPTAESLQAAKEAWLAARESYEVTEIFRLSNGPIDAADGWVAEIYGARDGQINSWPLDENMIDYSIDANGRRTSGSIIDTVGIFKPEGDDSRAVDVSVITANAIAALNENGGNANVASGYHAIEFLLWGQDQDYANFSVDAVTNGALTAGQRPLQDFTGNPGAMRRLQYLQAAAELLVGDLQTVSSAWNPARVSASCDDAGTGCYRRALLGQLQGADQDKNIPPVTALRQILGGMGMFIKSELANERIAVAVLTPSEEDEQSCFSDNTHRDITLNYRGFVNALKAELGDKSYGASLYASVAPQTRERFDALIASIDARIARMNQLAASRWHFDYQILPGNNDRDIRRMKNEMRKLGDLMLRVAADLGIDLSGGDVSDAGEKAS